MRWQPDELVTTHEPVTGHDQLPRQPRHRDDDLCRCAEREQGHYSRSHRRGDHVEGRPRLQVHCAGLCRQYTSWQLCHCDDPVRVRSQGEVHPDPLLIVQTSHSTVGIFQLLSPAAGQIHVPVCQAHGLDSRGESRLQSQ